MKPVLSLLAPVALVLATASLSACETGRFTQWWRGGAATPPPAAAPAPAAAAPATTTAPVAAPPQG